MSNAKMNSFSSGKNNKYVEENCVLVWWDGYGFCLAFSKIWLIQQDLDWENFEVFLMRFGSLIFFVFLLDFSLIFQELNKIFFYIILTELKTKVNPTWNFGLFRLRPITNPIILFGQLLIAYLHKIKDCFVLGSLIQFKDQIIIIIIIGGLIFYLGFQKYFILITGVDIFTPFSFCNDKSTVNIPH